MAYKVETLVAVARAGANIVVGPGYTPQGLAMIAEAVKLKGGHLTIKGDGLKPESMLFIANAAPGCVTFDTSADR